MNLESSEKDIPMSVAIVGFVALLGVLIYFKAPVSLSLILNELDRYAEANLIVIGITFFAALLNSIWSYSILSQTLGINRQGKRLEILAKQNLHKEKPKRKVPWRSFSFVVAVTPLIYILLLSFALKSFPSFVPPSWNIPLYMILAVNISFSIFVILGAAERDGSFQKIFGRPSFHLQKPPVLKNAILLGSFEEVIH